MYQNLKPIFTAFFLFITVVLELSTCQSTEKCHATNFWDLQNPIIPNELSDMICFNRSVTFMMGTDKPIFKLDGEGPKRKITLNPFCIDLKEVSNLQFLKFVQKTNYKTEVISVFMLTLIRILDLLNFLIIFQINRLNYTVIRFAWKNH